MKAVVLPENKDANLFRAFSGAKSSYTKTVGEATDALIKQFEPH